jgi:hypothetical protein
MGEETEERVARAIFRAEGRHASQNGDPWDVALSEFERQPYRNMARAAIGAMQSDDPGIPIYASRDATDDVLGEEE